MPAPAPRRRVEATITVAADSPGDLADWLLDLRLELLYGVGGPESMDRYTFREGAAGHVVVDVDETIDADSYRDALVEWARTIIAEHDITPPDLDESEPF